MEQLLLKALPSLEKISSNFSLLSPFLIVYKSMVRLYNRKSEKTTKKGKINRIFEIKGISMDQSFGAAIKKLRLAKGIEAKAIASPIISYSQLLKFENGQNLITVEKLSYILNFINISPQEFEHVRFGLSDTKNFLFDVQVEEAFWHKNTAKLKRLLQDTKEELSLHPENKRNYLNLLEIKAVLHRINSKNKLSKKEIISLTHYLSSVKTWSNYEAWLFLNSVELFSDSQLRELVDAMIHPKVPSIITNNTQSKINTALLNVISIFIQSKHFSPIPDWFSYLDKHIHSDIDMYERAILAYHKALFEYRQEPKSDVNINQVEKCISAFEILGCFDLVNMMLEEFQSYKKESQI